MWGRILRQVGDKGMVGVGKIRKRKKSSREEEEINSVKVYRESELKIVLWIQQIRSHQDCLYRIQKNTQRESYGGEFKDSGKKAENK